MIPYNGGDLKRAVALCVIVGSWLVALNQGSELEAGHFTSTLYLRVILDYATPFVVSSLTGIMRNVSDRSKRKGSAPRRTNGSDRDV